ncbi:hypothetical protein [Leptospira noguchii]|uniref:hypothetical protein n=1 Tax=Leptospira noguchii TaxID=28182 RepID=UPI0011474384|nr:hypothetical protein [Leptospira noguchii]TQE69943.1 hypothetical protein FF021_15195 [Leptospira noguchii]UOG52401.1 hypothetical protein MAL09_17805 [Leptospira noguchii]
MLSKQIQLFLWILFLFFLSTNKIWSHDIRLPDYFREEETSSYPFYLNFKLNQDFSALVRFPTKTHGKYQIVLGANTEFPTNFISLFKISLNGEGHKELPFQISKPTKRGRIFSIIDFTIKEGDAYRNDYVDLHIRIIEKKVNALNSKNKTLFNQNFLELGFRKKD